MDGGDAEGVVGAARRRGQRLIRIGRRGSELRLVDLSASGFRQRLRIDAFGRIDDVVLPLAGAFQASNALVAAGLAVGAGVPTGDAVAALAELEGAPARLELGGTKAKGAMIFIDYAHN